MKTKRYNKLVDKLTKLCGFNMVWGNQYFPSEEVVKSQTSLRKKFCNSHKGDCREILELLMSSGIMKIFYGDADSEAFIVFDTKAIRFTEDNFIEIEAGSMVDRSMEMPKSIIDEFSNEYSITLLPSGSEEDDEN